MIMMDTVAVVVAPAVAVATQCSISKHTLLMMMPGVQALRTWVLRFNKDWKSDFQEQQDPQAVVEKWLLVG